MNVIIIVDSHYVQRRNIHVDVFWSQRHGRVASRINEANGKLEANEGASHNTTIADQIREAADLFAWLPTDNSLFWSGAPYNKGAKCCPIVGAELGH